MEERVRILVVDDLAEPREAIEAALGRRYEIRTASSGPAALELFGAEPFDLVLSDYNMRPMNGIELLEQVKRLNPDVPFIIFTGKGDGVRTAVEAMMKGAYTYLEKDPAILETLELMVERALQFRSLVSENKELKNELLNKWDFVGGAPKLMEVRKFIEAVVGSRATVLITGETGTGKELAARWIHYNSPRRPGPFIKINCATLPEGLVESELFGYEKGAFTGAIKSRAGKFEAASGGTILLDEIGEMPMPAQAKLLRVIQEREVEKVGGDNPVQIDVRILAASNRNLEEEIKNGRFREDLFYRLNVFHVQLPPLRERKEDIIKLAHHFVGKYNEEDGLRVEGFDEGCEKMLLAYDWPGNIRELENTIQRAVILTRTGKIMPKTLTFLEGGKAPGPGGQGGAGFEAGMTIADAEKELIIKTLEYCAQNKTKAADMLGISIRTLRNKLNEYNMGVQDDGDEG
ncbi:MAG: sigma-54 dependent transcriptional regulator [Chitinispirillia bacterium]|nr:sigma-54 dependent transcriptional regulator [Chitinispirillia bacterium]MCL2241965.1 sigma-54 dependent transcriptional regulator [Chitinispirillia bacterium]MCL2242610.1 sigma-54 dependent transcriptional regulator [Chitinispirillia bacterium]